MDLPKSTYEYWVKRFDRENPDEELEEEIRQIKEENPNYGYRRVHAVLKKRGQKINIKKVHRLSKKNHLQVTSFTRKSRRYSSYRGEGERMAPNRINRRFNTCIPHQKITTDTTEFKYYEISSNGALVIKKLYLDPYMDMFNSEILAYSVGKHPSAENITAAMNKTIEITSDCPYRRTFHSDRGWAYTMPSYQKVLKDNRIFQSMSRKGNCHDNSVMENFFGILKQEIYYGKNYYSYESLVAAIDKFIVYYNEHRIKERLNWMSPVEYRLAHTT